MGAYKEDESNPEDELILARREVQLHSPQMEMNVTIDRVGEEGEHLGAVGMETGTDK